MSTARPTVLALVLAAALAACGGTADSDSQDLDDVDASVQPLEGDVASPSAPESEDASDTENGSDEPDDAEPSSDAATRDDETTDDETTDDGTDDDASEAASSCTLTDEDAGIELAAPTDGATVGTTFDLTGCGNTFEATYLWEFELDDGTIGGGGFGTMSCGTGCVGTFDESVTVDETGDGVLRVFEESAEDGGRINVVEIDLTVEP